MQLSRNSKDKAPSKSREGEGYLRRVARRFARHRLGVISLAFLGLVTLLAVFAPLVTPYSPTEIVGAFSGPPTKGFLLGTDQVGRDVFTRLIYGCRASLLVGLASTAISTAIGLVLGLLSGYFGGWVDMVVMRVTDMVMSFPYIMLVLVAAALVGPGLWNIIFILGFVNWPGVARLVRGSVLSVKESDFVKNSIVQGMPFRFLLFSEIMPSTLAPVFVYATSAMALSILDEAALSFLGLGIQPPAASLGNMLGGAQSLTILTSKPWLWLPPGIVIILVVMAVNFVGDALRDAIDPREER